MDAGKNCVVLAKASGDLHAESNHAATDLLSRKNDFFQLPQNVFFWKVFKGFFGGFKKHTLEVSQTGFF